MRRSFIAIVLSLVASVASFGFYLCKEPAVFLEAEDMNEILLAVFGAGISIFFTELFEFHYKKRDAEMALLCTTERVISGFTELVPVTVESIGDLGPQDVCNLLIEYFAEEFDNRILSALSPNGHEARDRLIRAIEHCDAGMCDAIASDASSHFNRYVLRVMGSVRKSAEGYLVCFDYCRKDINDLIDISSRLSSVPTSFLLARRKKNLDSINHILAEVCPAFSKIVGACRLFELGEAGYSELLTCCLEAEKKWVEHKAFQIDGNTCFSENKYIRELFCAIYEFASHVSPEMCRQYRNAASFWFSLPKGIAQL